MNQKRGDLGEIKKEPPGKESRGSRNKEDNDETR